MRLSNLFVLMLCFAAASCSAESPAGSWKRINSIVVDSNGTKSDQQPSLVKAVPCAANIVYEFQSSGGMRTHADGCPDYIKKASKKSDAVGNWKLKGNKVIVGTTDNALPPAIYSVSYEGNKMTWAFSYAENPNTPNPFKAKSTIIVYQRVK